MNVEPTGKTPASEPSSALSTISTCSAGRPVTVVSTLSESGFPAASTSGSGGSTFTSNDPGVGDAAVGNFEARYWSSDLKNEANQKYVADFKKKFGYTPSFYGAQSYDGIMLIDSAVRAVKGDLGNKKGLVAAMRRADYKSTRGAYRYNTNHFPIQNFYLLKAVSGPGGQDPVMEIQKAVFTNHKDAYAGDCKLKW